MDLYQFCKPCKNDHVSLPAILEEIGIVGVEEAAEGTGAGAACMHVGTTTSISNASWASVVLQCRIPAWRGPDVGGKYTSADT